MAAPSPLLSWFSARGCQDLFWHRGPICGTGSPAWLAIFSKQGVRCCSCTLLSSPQVHSFPISVLHPTSLELGAFAFGLWCFPQVFLTFFLTFQEQHWLRGRAGQGIMTREGKVSRREEREMGTEVRQRRRWSGQIAGTEQLKRASQFNGWKHESRGWERRKPPFKKRRRCSAAAIGSMVRSTERIFIWCLCIYSAVAVPDRYQSLHLRGMISFWNVYRYADGCIFPENTNNKTNQKSTQREQEAPVYPSIHPSIPPSSVPAFPQLGRRGLLEPIPAVKGWEAGCSLAPVYLFLLKIRAEGLFSSTDISVFTRVRVLPSCVW